MTVRLSKNIAKPYHKLFNDTKHTDQCITTGRAGAKSSFLGIKSVHMIISEPCAVVIMRKRHNKLRKTVYKEAIRAIRRLGLNPNKHFKCTVSPMQITYLKNGSTIYFTGNDNVDDTKGLIDDKFPIAYVAVDEVTEFFDQGDGEEELQNIKATFVRGNDKRFMMLYLFNPPKNPKAPVMKWLDSMKERPNFIHIHTDYRFIPKEWLGKILIEEAEILKQYDEKMYRWLWLGECIGLDDVIYYMFDSLHHVKKFKKQSLGHLGIGIDAGHLNATTYQAFGLNIREKKIKGVDEYYHSGRDTGKQKSPSEYAQDFKEFVKHVETITGQRVLFCVIDPSAAGLAEEISRVMGRNFKIIKANNTVAKGISRVQKLLSFLALEYSDTQGHLIEEKSLYMWDEKSIERGEEKPLKQNDHCVDAERYYIMAIWQHVVKLLPILKDKE